MNEQSIKHGSTNLPFGKIHLNLQAVFIRMAEPVLFGVLCNVVISFLLNSRNPQFLLEEFITACILAVPITELNRYIDKRLEKKFNWIHNPQKRLIIQLLLVFLCLVLLLNVLGTGYMWVTQKGFFSINELLIINLAALCLFILLTVVKWGAHFYRSWLKAEKNAEASAQIIAGLREKLMQPVKSIELQKGTAKLKTAIQNIRLAKIESGIVRIYTDTGYCGIFNGSLSQLGNLLPQPFFFQAGRDAILHKDIIHSTSPSSFGKIHITLQEKYKEHSGLTVSRPKAAAFRKWYNSI